jgi:ATP-binding cassette subfamily B protein
MGNASDDTLTGKVTGLPSTPIRFILYFIRRYRIWYVTIALFETLNSACLILTPFAMGRIISAVAHTAQPGYAASLKRAAMMFIALTLGEVVFSRASGALQMMLMPRQRHAITRSLYAYVQGHSHSYFAEDGVGATVHRIHETSVGVAQTLHMLIFDFWPTIVTFTVSILVLSHIHALLAGLTALWAVASVLVSLWLATRCRPYVRAASVARTRTIGSMADALSNISSARLFARFAFERHKLNGHLTHEMDEMSKANRRFEGTRWLQFVAAAILKVAMLYFAWSLWDRAVISVADFVVASTTCLLIIGEARGLGRRFLDLFEFLGSVASGVEALVKPHGVTDAPYAVEANVVRGQIEFRHVSFGYSPGRTLFRDLNLTIHPGQRVGLVGISGAGKSSFVNLILRLFDPTEGQILIDGIDVREMTQESLHRHISLIPQDPNLFHRSLMDNIRYGRLEATDDEVISAAKQAHAHEFIVDIPGQYAALVGDRGVRLSGGQRQRIAIARVILKNSPVLVLDEATASLDSITEQAIRDTLDETMMHRSSLVIAHRLSTIAHLDRILVFDHGRIVEDASHADLIAKRGAYHRLWSRQVDGFFPSLLANEVA